MTFRKCRLGFLQNDIFLENNTPPPKKKKKKKKQSTDTFSSKQFGSRSGPMWLLGPIFIQTVSR